VRTSWANAAETLGRAGLADLGFALYQRVRAAGGAKADDLPPPYLRVLTAGDTNPEAFRILGSRMAQTVLATAELQGLQLSSQDAVLDFGCGCGRVAAPLIAATDARVHGCDVNGRLVQWCRRRLDGDFRRTRPEPPLPYADQAFSLVYALSVFTHLHEANAQAWLAELARVTRKGGLAVLSLFDEDMPAAAEFRPSLLDRGFLVRREGAEGSNLLCGYFSRAGFAQRAEAAGWRTLEIVPSASSGLDQALAVLARD
jgi:SAM-dependent methyltransferase